MRWVCRPCGCLYTAGAPCCPACRATEHDEEAAPPATEEDEVPKISSTGVATTGPVTSVHAPEILPDGAQASPGTGVPVTGTEHPVDGTMSPPVTGDAPAPVAAEPPAPAPAAVTPPGPEPSPAPAPEVTPAPPAKPAPAPAAKPAAAPAPAQPKKAGNG